MRTTDKLANAAYVSVLFFCVFLIPISSVPSSVQVFFSHTISFTVESNYQRKYVASNTVIDYPRKLNTNLHLTRGSEIMNELYFRRR